MTLLTTLALASLTMFAAAPTAAADGSEGAQCNEEPLGEPDPENPGLDDHVKAFGNPVIYGACLLVLTVAGEAIVLAIDAANLVCDFATGEPCLDGVETPQ